ncbi:MAG: hypothetical protein AAF998_20735 [Bacteroidota bacterium]
MPIDSHLRYVEKNAFAPPQIAEPPPPDLGMVIAIPCFDEPDLIGSLTALQNCTPPPCAVEVIVVINSGVHHPAEVKTRNQKTREAARTWAKENRTEHLRFHFLHFPELPKKHAGVGLARKIGMDEAVRRLETVARPDAPIVCFDADATCAPNYLVELAAYFADNPKMQHCSIHFEHPIAGDEHSEAVYAGIIRYELYLRYYVNGLRLARSPYAHHTIGSSMAVRSALYQSEGGMNRRKAGEDFYFLNKLPREAHGELTTTRVIPSPRISHRVPFGTGKAIHSYVEGPDPEYPVYAPEAFRMWRAAMTGIADWFTLGESALKNVLAGFPEPLAAYLREIDFVAKVRECQRYTRSPEKFGDRYHHWLNGLRTLQFFHHFRDHHRPNVPLRPAALAVLRTHFPAGELPENLSLEDLLAKYRELDRQR